MAEHAHNVPLLLGGFMGVGKSTLGRHVATMAGVPFLDLDETIAARAKRSIADIFRDLGEPAFRALEREELERVLDEGGSRVVALGGGALLDETVRRKALERARVVTLVGRPEALAARVAGTPRPLLAGHTDPAARVRELLAARAPAYAEAHAHVATDVADIATTAEAVLRAWTDRPVLVRLGARSYAVRIATNAAATAADIASSLHPTGAFVVTDVTVHRLWGRELAAGFSSSSAPPVHASAVLEPGEQNKTLASVERALRSFVEAGADRSAVVIAHGGGVVSDIAGFTAATLLRGVRWISIPTTLLAMVDASVGGKTGVDLGQAKNAVGAFHQPSGVVVGVAHTKTETPRAFASGLAEVVKAAAIGDPDLFALLEERADAVVARDEALLADVIERAVHVKADIVARDERESGDRALLNFGHTLGHALEAHGGFTTWTHGEAVAIGMAAAARIGIATARTDGAAAARLVALLKRLQLPTDAPADAVRAAVGLIRLDKKRRGDRLRFVWLREIGRAFVELLPIDELERRLAES